MAAELYGERLVEAAPLVWNTQMLVSAAILGLTFIAIFTEQFHQFDRTRIAMAGGGAMIVCGQIFGFYGPAAAMQAIDWNVVFLLGGMMTIVAIMAPTGGFENLAYRLARASRGRLFLLLVFLGTAVTLLSLLLDNVTTVVIFGPLIILITRALKTTPVPYLIAAAMLSNTGGVATLVGDPPNLMIGSAAGIDFNTFAIRMGGIVLVAWLVTLLAMRLAFRTELKGTAPAASFEGEGKIVDPHTWRASLIALGITLVLFVLHGKLDWEPWVVAAFGLTLLLFLVKRVRLDTTFEHVEIALLTFFISLFIVVGGVQHSHFLQYVGQFIGPFVHDDLLTATIALLWIAAMLSAAIDNIPFTAAMIPVIQGLESQGLNATPLYWALAVGVGLGGNGTHIGSTANVYVVTISERLAREHNDPSLAITPGLWIRKGTPAMLLTLLTSTAIFWLFFDFFAKPIH
ncbi:MAG TPA: SLC13 family permease [Pseudomonadales bacterium]|nr:SLC13 family permease [Pseudomonadales bacterium]